MFKAKEILKDISFFILKPFFLIYPSLVAIAFCMAFGAIFLPFIFLTRNINYSINESLNFSIDCTKDFFEFWKSMISPIILITVVSLALSGMLDFIKNLARKSNKN